MKRFFYKLLWSTGVLMIIVTVFWIATSTLPWLMADQAYRQGRYDEAVKYYRYALFMHPDSSVLNFNLGGALYRKGDFKRAAACFKQAAEGADKDLRRIAHFNLANCRYHQGQNEGDRGVAVRFYRKSLAHYDRVLALDGQDADALHNRSVVDKALEGIYLRVEREEQKMGSGDPGGGDESRGQSPREKGSLAGRQKAADENIRQKDPADEAGGKKTGKGSRTGPIQFKRGEMSREDAELLLEAFRMREQAGAVLADRARKGRSPGVEKDW